MMVVNIIGIDPGKKGAVVVISGFDVLLAERTPLRRDGNRKIEDAEEITKLLKQFDPEETIAYMEEIYATPKHGSFSMLSFGKGFGIWIGVCAGLGIPLKVIKPKDWKKKVLGDSTSDKEVSIEKSKELFPSIELKPGRIIRDHDGLAEASLIAFYGGLEQWCQNGGF